jgi:hypothetical protein
MNLRLTTMTAAVALMFFTPIASYTVGGDPARIAEIRAGKTAGSERVRVFFFEHYLA